MYYVSPNIDTTQKIQWNKKNQGLPSEYVDNLFSCFLSGHVMNTMGDLFCPPCNITKRSTVSAMFRVLNGFASLCSSHSPQGSSITQYRPLGRYGERLGFTPNHFWGRNWSQIIQFLAKTLALGLQIALFFLTYIFRWKF